MKLRTGQPKYGAIWGGFLLLFCLFSYLGYSTPAMLAMAGFMTGFLVGMIAERRAHEAKHKAEETPAGAERPA